MIEKARIFSLLIFVCFFMSFSVSAQQEAKIVLAETGYDFGKIEAKNGVVKHSFFVKNEGAASLELIRVVASCECISSKWLKKAIEAGQTGEIEISYNPKGRSGFFNHNIEVFSNGSDKPIVLSVKGKVDPEPDAPSTAPEFSPDAWSYDFGRINEEDGFAIHVFQIKNTGTAPLIISHVQSSCGCAQPEWTSDPIPPGEIGDVVITYSPKNRPGPFRKNVTVYTNAKGGRQRLTIKGEVIPKPTELSVAFHDTIGAIQLEKKEFVFYTVRPKEITTQEIWIRNFSDVNRTLSFENIPAHIKVEAPEQLEPHKAERLKVTVDGGSVTMKGRQCSKLTWQTRNASGEVVSYDIPVSVNFIDDFSTLSPSQKNNGPAIKLSTTLLEYGKLKKNSFLGLFGSKYASKQVTLTNDGKALLELHSISCDDERVNVTGFKKRMLRPGESITLKLSIRKKDVSNPMVTALFVVCNDPRGPVRQVKITAE